MAKIQIRVVTTTEIVDKLKSEAERRGISMAMLAGQVLFDHVMKSVKPERGRPGKFVSPQKIMWDWARSITVQQASEIPRFAASLCWVIPSHLSLNPPNLPEEVGGQRLTSLSTVYDAYEQVGLLDAENKPEVVGRAPQWMAACHTLNCIHPHHLVWCTIDNPPPRF